MKNLIKIRISASVLAISAFGMGSADTYQLYVAGVNYDTVTGYDGNTEVYMGSQYGTLTDTTTNAYVNYGVAQGDPSTIACIDTGAFIYPNSTYDVTVSGVDDQRGYILDNEASIVSSGLNAPNSTLSNSASESDAGLQIAIWQLTGAPALGGPIPTTTDAAANAWAAFFEASTVGDKGQALDLTYSPPPLSNTNGYQNMLVGFPSNPNMNVNPVPEPFTMTLGIAGVGLAVRRRIARKASA